MTADPWCAATEHDTRRAYRFGCRCSTARAEQAAYTAALRKDNILGRKRLVDATGTRRRIEALHALGWTGSDIGKRLGVDASSTRDWRGRKRIMPSTAARVMAVYDELSMTPGPSNDTRIRALRAGWPPPLAWDDDEIDDPAARPTMLTFREVRAIHIEEMELLAECGQTWAAIEARTGFVKNSIQTRLARADRRDITRRISRNSEGEARISDRRNQWSA